MAISTDVTVEFFGTKATVHSTAAASIGSSLFSSSAMITAWTNSDDAPMATAVLVGLWGTAPASGGVMNMYGRLMNIGAASTSATQPSTAYKYPYLASFSVATSTAIQIIPSKNFDLPNSSASQIYEFYLDNQTSQTMSSDWELYVTPKAWGPNPA